MKGKLISYYIVFNIKCIFMLYIVFYMTFTFIDFKLYHLIFSCSLLNHNIMEFHLDVYEQQAALMDIYCFCYISGNVLQELSLPQCW